MILIKEQLAKEPTETASINEAVEIINKLEWELAHSSISGIGLAAPQIGINKAVAIIRIPNADHNGNLLDPAEPFISVNLVNPVLLEATDFALVEEGCLSFPNEYVKTIRYQHITLETADDYEFYAEQLNANRYKRPPKDMPLFSSGRRKIALGKLDQDNLDAAGLSLITSICVQHEFSHLLGLTMYDFKPQEVGRNDRCPLHKEKKNKKCCNIPHYNANLERLLNPNYRSA